MAVRTRAAFQAIYPTRSVGATTLVPTPAGVTPFPDDWNDLFDSVLMDQDISANGRSLIGAADYAAMRALLDLESGVDFLSPAAIAAAYQPLDADLTAIAALSTTSFGRSFLVLADASAGRTLLALGSAATHAAGDFDSAGAAAAAQAASQPLDSDLTAIAALSTTAYGRGLLTLANAAAADWLPLAGGTMTGVIVTKDGLSIQFGGTSSSFPALKRTTTYLEARLADDSSGADLHARHFLASYAGTPTICAYSWEGSESFGMNLGYYALNFAAAGVNSFSYSGIFGLKVAKTLMIGWSNADDNMVDTAFDVAFGRTAAKIVEINDGTLGAGHGGALQLWEMTAPSASGTDGARLYLDNGGSGSTSRLLGIFQSGAAKVIAQEMANEDLNDVKTTVASGVTSTVAAGYARVVPGLLTVDGTLIVDGLLLTL